MAGYDFSAIDAAAEAEVRGKPRTAGMVAPDATEERVPHNFGVTEEHLGVEIGNELVKSFGFSYSSEGGVDWSLDTIVQAFDESPVWTTIDWLTVAVPVAKWGSAAYKINKGVGAAGKIVKSAKDAGEITGAGLRGPMKSMREAVRIHEDLPRPRGLIRSPVGRLGAEETSEMLAKATSRGVKLTDEESLLVSKGILAQSLRERDMAIAAAGAAGQDLYGAFGRFSDKSREIAGEAIREKHGSTAYAELAAKLTPKERKILDATAEYRDSIIKEYLRATGREDLLESSLGQWMPHVYTKYFEGGMLVSGEDFAAVGGRLAPGMSTKQAQKHLISRVIPGDSLSDWKKNVAAFNKETGQNLEIIVDPRAGIVELAKMASVPASVRFAETLAKTPMVKHADELAKAGVDDWVEFGSLIPGRTGTIGGNKGFQAAMKTLDEARATGDPAAIAAAEKGRKVAEHRALVPGPYKFIPDELMGLKVDPLVADEVKDLMKLTEIEHNPIMDTLRGMTQFFKLSKTAYNPATHGRNFLANEIFHSFATGRIGGPVQGINTIRKALKGDKKALEAVNRAREHGVLGHTFDREALDDLMDVYGAGSKGMSWATLGADRLPIVGGIIARGAKKSQRLYGYEDDVWKLSAFLHNEKKFKKALGAGNEALASTRAAHETVKFFPMYGETNELTKIMRQYVPFSSFTTEAFRVWKNAMIWKPHWAMAWTHSAEWATQVAAASMGVSPEEMDAAARSLPNWTEGKKMFLLPWRDGNDTLQFLDMSYLIPMADMAGEAEKGEGSMFFLPNRLNPVAGAGVMSNPLISIAAAATMDVDPFSGREIEPRFLERSLPNVVPRQGATREFLGLAEHVARTMAPPVLPPGYAGMNIVELAKGQKSPSTGMPLEPDWGVTLAANLLGLRNIKPDEPGARSQEWKKRNDESELMKSSWARLDWALVNGDKDQARVERQWIVGHIGEAEFQKRLKGRAKRKQKNSLSIKQVERARGVAEAGGGRLVSDTFGSDYWGDTGSAPPGGGP